MKIRLRHIRILLLSLQVLIFIPALHGQDGIHAWDPTLVEKANTAGNAEYLTPEEKEVILIANLARLDGTLFSETFLNPYLKDKKSTRYTRSLYKELKEIRNLPLLYPREDLFRIAKEHAETSGKRGTVGHQRFEKRFEPLMQRYQMVAENCAYGFDKATDIVIQLLIDEGIPDLGHRKNLLNPELDCIGVSVQPHKNFRVNCVMDFGGKEQ